MHSLLGNAYIYFLGGVSRKQKKLISHILSNFFMFRKGYVYCSHSYSGNRWLNIRIGTAGYKGRVFCVWGDVALL